MLHIIQNDPHVPPGNLLDYIPAPYVIHQPCCGEALPEAESIAALIVLGGTMGAGDDRRHPFLRDLKTLIGTVVAAGIPYLGICLGGQLLAAACGAQVMSNRWEELGSLSVRLTPEGRTDALFTGITPEFATFQWHHDSFDIPQGGILLAASAACPHQAFRVGERAWGLQFHPEVTETIIRDWCGGDKAVTARADELVEDFCRREATYRATAETLWRNFLHII